MYHKCNFEYLSKKKWQKKILYNNLYLNLMIKYKKAKTQENGPTDYYLNH